MRALSLVHVGTIWGKISETALCLKSTDEQCYKTLKERGNVSMTIDNQQSHQSSQLHQSSQAQAYASLLTDSMVNRESKLRSFKKSMVLSKKDYIIIILVSIVMLILGGFQPTFFLMFLFEFFTGIGSIFTNGFGSFIFGLPVLLWALFVIFLPVVLVLHVILDRKLKAMLEKLEKSSEQHNKSVTA
ncbi:hypothetical protein [Bartonella gliris]|uniref:hypothetical protein n=1 Tax=Bartonella gliris TaxID=3004109 RepID=UPI00295F2E82|nr:hypothetical protein [Bartonella gliris]